MSNKTKIKDAIKTSTRASRSVPICLDAGMTSEFEALERKLSELEHHASDSLAGNGANAVAEELLAMRERMQEHTFDFVIEAMGRHRFRRILTEHPPTEGNVEEKLQGFADTLYEALIKACLTSPELDEEDWLALFGRPPGTLDDEDEGVDGKLSDAQFESLSNATWQVNRRDVSVPFSPAASRLRRTSEAE